MSKSTLQRVVLERVGNRWRVTTTHTNEHGADPAIDPNTFDGFDAATVLVAKVCAAAAGSELALERARGEREREAARAAREPSK